MVSAANPGATRMMSALVDPIALWGNVTTLISTPEMQGTYRDTISSLIADFPSMLNFCIEHAVCKYVAGTAEGSGYKQHMNQPRKASPADHEGLQRLAIRRV